MNQSSQNFGPWSTSLDAGMRLQLSAFWKRRMTSLVSLPLQSTRLSRRRLAAALTTIAVLAAAPLIQFSPILHAADKAIDKKDRANEREAALPAVSDRGASYGEAIERTVNDNGHGEYLIDFDSGKLYAEPEDREFENDRQFADWARSKGIDAMGQVSSSYKGLIGFDMIAIPSDAGSWNKRPGGVIESLESGDPGTPANMDARGGLPATFFIQTREGARGVLQILGYDEDSDRPGPDNVRLRYKPIVAATDAAGAQQAESSSSTAGAKPRAASDGEFVARFSNGVEVELIGLSVNPSKDQPWWRPDGSPLAERPYTSARTRIGSGLPREICWRWKNLPKDPDYTLSWNTVPSYEAAGDMGPFDANGKRIEGLWAAAVGLTGSPEACTVRFSASVSATPWKTVFEQDGRHYASAGSIAGGKPRSVIWSPARQEGDELLITVSFKAPGESVRLVAIDESEQQHAAVRVYGGGASDFMQQTFAFDELPLEAIDRFELQTQTREIETIEFANVSLEAGKLTKVTTQAVKTDDNPLKR